MRILTFVLGLSLTGFSIDALAIPPALPGDAERQAEADKQRQKNIANLASPEAKKLVEKFFQKLGEGEGFDISELFVEDAHHINRYGEWTKISDNLDDEGFPDIPQWEMISIFRLGNCWAAAADLRLEQIGVDEAVVKFFFERNKEGALRISRIEEVSLNG